MFTYILAAYDFGYAWPWTYGHLFLSFVLAGLALLLWKRVPRWASAIIALGMAWAFASFLIVHYGFLFTSPLKLPTEHFMANGGGRVLDIGAGSGRATIMVGTARPSVRVTALDNFSADYIKGNGPERLMANAREAGIDKRVDVLTADMRKIPAEAGSYDGVVSSYAIDHLNRKGIGEALAEVGRVLKPNGEFLLMIIAADAWLKFTFGPLLLHQQKISPEFWRKNIEGGGLQIVEEGRLPGTKYYLCRKR